MDKIFNENQFVATQWDTAEQKAKFANHFVRFINGGFKITMFPKWFYTRLSMTRGHIAHFNLHGFYDEWFSDIESQKRFIQHWIVGAVYGDPTYTYSDVENALQSYLQKARANVDEQLHYGYSFN